MDDDTSLAVVTAEEELLVLLVLVVLVMLLMFVFVSFLCWLEFWLEFADVETADAEENNDNTPPIKKHNLLLIVVVDVVIAVSSMFKVEFSDDVKLANVVLLLQLGEGGSAVEVIQVLTDDEVLKFNIIPGQQQKHINLNVII